MQEKCSITAYQGCNYKKYANYDECVLHCSKEEPLKDYHKSFDMLEKFYNHLIDYIVQKAFKVSKENDKINETTVRKYLYGETIQNGKLIEEFIKEKTVVFNCIAFPVRDSREPFDYLPVLQKLGKTHFNYCKFYLSSLEIENVECFFQDCEFFTDWFITDYNLLQNVDKVIYQQCTFNGSCSYAVALQERAILTHSQFNGCEFKDELIFENLVIEEPFFKDWKGFKGRVKLLKISNCEIKGRFTIDDYHIDELYFKNINFNQKFEFKNCDVKVFEIDNCNFNKLAEFYQTKFERFEIFKSIFEDYTGFEQCKFGIAKNLEEKYIANFKFVTFLNFINFRKTKFNSGLSFEDTNIKDTPNFLNSEIEFENTSRETFRIIKHSFDKLGSHIEANKFFALEMKKYKNDLFQSNGNYQEKIVFCLNNFISDFGQNYLKPFGLVVCTAIVYMCIFYGFKENWILSIFNKDGLYFQAVDVLNGFASSVILFKKFLPKGLEFLTLFFMILQSTFIWHFLIAVKRHTKR